MIIKNRPVGSQITQPTITTTWDDANRLRKIRQEPGAINANAAQIVLLDYDDANRPQKTTLPNLSSIGYGYDDADQLRSIDYRKADSTLIGNLTYDYDAEGRRVATSGSLARSELPGASVTDAQYDPNNRLTRWAGKTYIYDDNGNLIADGTHSYQWDERNQLKAISAGATAIAGFGYDALGRRTNKTLGGATTGFVYDGDNFIQELLGTTNTAAIKSHLLTAGIDQTYLRIDIASGTRQNFLSDGTNHTVRLLDQNQTKLVDYSYEPYGTTTADAANANTQQYTGRENDNPGNAQGLYYYRARYYMPGCARFISEDPIGWASGQTNNYSYVGGDPVLYRDPAGQWLIPVGIAVAVTWGIYSAWKSYSDSEKFACSFDKAAANNARYGDLMDKFMKQPLTSQEAKEFQDRDRQRPGDAIQATADAAKVAQNAVSGSFGFGRGVAAGIGSTTATKAAKPLGTAAGLGSGCQN